MNFYYHKWIPRFFYKKPDGGKDSGVTGYFLLEWKTVFSIGILHFSEGSREAFHNHAFNAFTWWLKGRATEIKHPTGETYEYHKSLKPKYTPRDNFHKVIAQTSSWALTIRGPWKDTWREFKNEQYVNLTHGRKVI